MYFFKNPFHLGKKSLPAAWVAEIRARVFFVIVPFAHTSSSCTVKTLLSSFLHRAQSSTKSPPNSIRKLLKRWKRSSSKFPIVLTRWKYSFLAFGMGESLVCSSLEYWAIGLWLRGMHVICYSGIHMRGKSIWGTLVTPQFREQGEIESNNNRVFIWNNI